MKKILLFTLLLLAVLKANADSNIRIGDLYFTTTDGVTCVFDGVGPGTSGKVEVPAEFDYTAPLYPYYTYHNLKVVAISNTAFTHSYERSVEEVVLPETITEIGEGAFWDCTSLKRINIPSKVTELKGNFNYCKSLESITIPNTVLTIDNSFNHCDTIANFIIEDGEATLSFTNSPLFYTNIKKVYQGRNCIGESIFSKKVIEELTIGDNVTEIGNRQYEYNTFKEISLGSNIATLGTYAFYGCNELRELNLPESLTDLGIASFSGCENLISVSIPSKIKEINNNFSYCKALNKVIIPASVMTVDDSFISCDTIAEFVIADSDTPISFLD